MTATDPPSGNFCTAISPGRPAWRIPCESSAATVLRCPLVPQSSAWLLAMPITVKPAALRLRAYEGGLANA